ncbi:hypothetical protein MAIT1_03396 [Magnetofaba australis IT-1]|uniref:YhdP central domain-containing protein n=1 Tax=Magnetofaba australis IT-1 TaxID=1434232 RepID=A0A1Y2K6F0_9PROT|nr:hypothetical protein MAIT1_03396 [Magnetofaba australis IT-1]
MYIPLLTIFGVVMWLTYFPPQINEYKDEIVTWLEAATGFHAEIGRLKLALGPSLLTLQAHGLTLTHPQAGAEPVARVRLATLRLAPRSWLSNPRHIPLELTLVEPRFNVARSELGNVWVGNLPLAVWRAEGAAAQVEPYLGESWVNEWLNRLAVAIVRVESGVMAWSDAFITGEPDAPFTAQMQLRAIKVWNPLSPKPVAEMDGVTWMPASGDESLRPIQISGRAERATSGRWRLQAAVGGARVAHMAPYVAQIPPLRELHAPLDVAASLALGGGEPWNAQWEARIGTGSLTWKPTFRWPFPIQQLRARGTAQQDAPGKGWSLRADAFRYRGDGDLFAKGLFSVSGLGLKSAPILDLTATAGGAPTGIVNRFYPVTYMNPNLVNWLDTRLKKGGVSHATARIRGPVDRIPFHRPSANPKQEIFRIQGMIHNVDVSYFPGLPPIGDAEVILTFDKQVMTAEVKHADWGSSKRVRGVVRIPHILNGDQTVEVDARCRADIGGVWREVIANPKLRWDKRVALNGSDFSGQGEMKFLLTLPVNRLDDAQYDVSLRIDQADIRPNFLDAPLQRVTGLLHADNQSMTLSDSSALYKNRALALDLTADAYQNPGATDLSVNLATHFITDELRDWLAPALQPGKGALTGSIPARLSLRKRPKQKDYAISGSFNLDGLSIAGKHLLYKPRGEPASWSFDGALDVTGEKVTLARLKGQVGSLAFSGSADWAYGRNRGGLLLDKLKYGRNNGALSIQAALDKAYAPQRIAVNMDWRVLDLSHWLTRTLGDSTSNAPTSSSASSASRPAKSAIAAKPPPEITLHIVADETILANDKRARDLEAQGELRENRLSLPRASFSLDDASAMLRGSFAWKEQWANGPYTGDLFFTSGNLGQLLDALGLSDSLQEDEAQLEFKLEGERPLGAPLFDSLSGQGDLLITKGSLRQVSSLSSLLGLFSLQKLPNLLMGDRPDLESNGFYFETLSGGLRLSDGALFSDQGVTLTGPSLKIVVSGEANISEDRLNLLVGARPLQTLDAIVSKVPLLGKLVAGERDAVLETQFGVTGPLRDPKVRLKPMSAIAPGIIRDILHSNPNAPDSETDAEDARERLLDTVNPNAAQRRE